MKSKFEPVPILAASNVPSVSAVTGLGSGGAGLHTEDNGALGEIILRAGNGVLSSGSVAITFPGTPPALFISGDELIGNLSQSTVSKTVTISWTGAKMLPGNSLYKIAFEWAVSN